MERPRGRSLLASLVARSIVAPVVLLLAAMAPAQRVTEGRLFVCGTAGTFERIDSCVLEHTEVKAVVAGSLATVEVAQRFQNPSDAAIEAVYVFPLPVNAAVHRFVLEVQGRRIVGSVRARPEAQRIYDAAKADGLVASLLTEERPNLFTQRVANLPPREPILITLTYIEQLEASDGGYTFAFPMVVGPRYGASIDDGAAAPSGGAGGAPPSAPPEALLPHPIHVRRSGKTIALSLEVVSPFPIRETSCASHEVMEERAAASRVLVRLRKDDEIPNRDFVFRWKVAGDVTQLGVLAHRKGNEGFFTLSLQPQLHPAAADVAPREITFIVDVSGSMNGDPIRMSRDIVLKALDRLRPDDLFNIFVFAVGNGQLWDAPRPRSAEALVEARAFLDTHHGSGGTEMMKGLLRALDGDHDPRRLQMYCFLTDGLVREDTAILETIKARKAEARFFAFGPGSSVNRYLLDGIGEEGCGTTVYANPRDAADANRCVDAFLRSIDTPVLTHLTVEWTGLPVADLLPLRIPDLFAGKTIELAGRFTAAAEGTIVVRGRVGALCLEFPVAVRFPEREESHAGLATVWARRRIHDLSRELLGADTTVRSRLETEITRLGIEHGLLTPFTAFVAVDTARKIGDGAPGRVDVPLEFPEGMFYVMTESFEQFGLAEAVEGDLLTMSSGGRALAGAIGIGGGTGSGQSVTRRMGASLSSTQACRMIGSDWATRHQSPDGSWNPAEFAKRCDPMLAPCPAAAGDPRRTPGTTALDLLTRFGAGYDTVRPSPYLELVKSGLKYLRLNQDASGRFGEADAPRARETQAQATLAMVEAYAASQQTVWKIPADLGLAVCASDLAKALQSTPIDVEGACWAHFALRAARAAGLRHDESALELKLPELLAAAKGAEPAAARGSQDDALLAFVAFHRVWKHADWASDPSAVALIERLKTLFATAAAEHRAVSPKAWYFGALALFNAGGESWEAYSKACKEEVLGQQLKEGCAAGCWDPERFGGDLDGVLGSTAWLNLALHIYHRYPRVLGTH